MKSKITLTLSILLLSVSAFAAHFNIGFGGSIGFVYSPQQTNVTVGDTVIWTGNFASHPLASLSVPNGATTFNYAGANSTFLYVVTVVGNYNFECAIHHFTGTINAVEPSFVGAVTQQTAIAIYPTSVHNFLKITIPSNTKPLFAEVKNIVGQTALKVELSGEVVNTLDLSNLINGFYFVAIRSNMEVVKVVRIVKE